jgi:hypothetical protein
VSRPSRAVPPVPIVQEAEWAPEPVWTQRLDEKSFANNNNNNNNNNNESEDMKKGKTSTSKINCSRKTQSNSTDIWEQKLLR